MLTFQSITDKYQQSQVLFECLHLHLYLRVILIVIASFFLLQDTPGELGYLILLDAAPFLCLAPLKLRQFLEDGFHLGLDLLGADDCLLSLLLADAG
jgi:hypothetical protein